MYRDILLLLDYRDQFYFSTKYRGASVDIHKLRRHLGDHGFNLIEKYFHELNFRENNYKGTLVLYQSSEDPDLLYKDYIEDILLGLEMQGAKLIPEFKYFRAHHNKVFMEVLRDISGIAEIGNLSARTFGTFEEYEKSGCADSEKTFVIKPGSGTRSKNVRLLQFAPERRLIPFRLSRSFTFENLKLLASRIKSGRPYTPMSNNRRKFIIQEFVEGLDGDYRILAYGKKFFAVFRKNRKGDFTASGSGNLDFNKDLPDGLLEYAETVYEKFNTPYMSLDIGHKDGTFYLFEYQCLCLGQYTLEKSEFYYSKLPNGDWCRTVEIPDLEREIAESISLYLSKNVCVE